jgi:hypothetical protein
MPTSNSAVAVGTTAVEVATSDTDPKFVYLQDGDFAGDSETFVGGSSVTTANGIKLSKANVMVFQLFEYDTLHAISTTAGGSVRVVEVA